MEKQSNIATSEEDQKGQTSSKGDESAKTEKTETPKKEELTLTDEQWSLVFQHPRFTQLNEKVKEAEKLKKEQTIEIQKKLKEEGKYKELLEEKEKELEQLTTALNEAKLNNDVISIASKLNVVDTEAVSKLIDRSKLETDAEGNYINVEPVVQELISQKPYLVNAQSSSSSNIGSSANTTTESQSGDIIITLSELREKLKDHSWYLKNKENIKKWEREGRIDYDK